MGSMCWIINKILADIKTPLWESKLKVKKPLLHVKQLSPLLLRAILFQTDLLIDSKVVFSNLKTAKSVYKRKLSIKLIWLIKSKEVYQNFWIKKL